MEEGRVTKHIFDCDHNVCNISNNWYSDLKKRCCELNILDSFENKHVSNIKEFDKQLLELKMRENELKPYRLSLKLYLKMNLLLKII